MKYAVVTFGCRVNQADSIGFEEEFLAAGAEPSSPERADIVIVNTCSVTATADQGARQTIRRVARENPAARIVVTGCYATRSPEEVAALPNVVRVVANDEKPRLIPLLAVSSVADDGPCGAGIEPGVAGRTAYTLRVQTGCDEPCAYCIIPSTRGASRSVPLDILQREIDRVSAAGFKEIALTGVHLGSYGRDLSPATSLVDLLRAIAARDLLFRISSLEPMDCSDEIIDLVAASDCFAPHFHLPLQHASDRVLAAMRRPYTIEHYARVVDRIRARMANASIGSDIIVGFPGETDEDFAQLASYLERSPLSHIHVFPYSDRPGTAASALPDKVHGAIVRDRARRIRDIGATLSQRFRAAQLGTLHRALTIDDGSIVVTGNYLKIGIHPGRARNEWVDVRISQVAPVMFGAVECGISGNSGR
jgi:threonylcarbamoyladenosine tRNA methylthiotransferase MtaB